ncbi:hypothetical protein Aperf_G00000049856 [Anoplocephala perfoliata]
MDGNESTRSLREPNCPAPGVDLEKRGGLGGMGIPEVDETMGGDESWEREEPGESRTGTGDRSEDYLLSSLHYRPGAAVTPSAKKSWTFDTGEPLTCIATSNYFPLIAVAGRNLLQVLRVDEDRFVAVHRITNLQRSVASAMTVNAGRSGAAGSASSAGSAAAVTSTSTAHFQPPRSYAINDVAWSNSKSTLATCSNAGDLIIWDLSRGISQSVCFIGHSRSVHRIHFNPNAPNEIISASHDGTVKLFDIRDQSCRQVFHARTSSSSPVRDVVYCPHESHTLAGAFENGLVCIWDTRYDSRPARSFQAHNAVTTSIDWHPMWNSVDRNWLATAGGRDNTILVWDLNKPSPTTVYSLRAKNTGHVRWRIGETTQLISSCSLSLDLNIHLWELNRPFIPYITFEGHTHTIVGIAWSTDPNSFYSVGRDGLLIRHYIGDGIQIARVANPVALALNCRGPLAHALGGEPGQRIRSGGVPPLETIVRQITAAQPFRDPTAVATALTAKRTPHQLLVTRRSHLPPQTGLSEEEERAQPVAVSEGETPPNIIPAEDFIAQSQSELFVADFILEKLSELEAPMATLLLPDTFIYLAKNYRITGSSIEEVCDHNADVARHVNQDFLSQFWLQLKLILGHCWQYSEPIPPISSPGRRNKSTRHSNRRRRNGKPLVSRSQAESNHLERNSEVANSCPGSVCILDFVASQSTEIDEDDHRATEAIGEDPTPVKKENSVINIPSNTAGSGVISTATATSQSPSITSSTAQRNNDDTGSLGRSVNFLFSVDTHRSSENQVSTPVMAISSLPEESDAFCSSMLPSLPDSVVLPSSNLEEEQFPALAPESQRKLEPKLSGEESTGSQNRLHESSRDQQPSSAILDLTSSVNCVEQVDSTFISNSTLPLDFTHLVGQWFLEMIEAGHAQTVCTALLIFGTERTRINEWASEKQIENWFHVYLDSLVHFRLWCVCTTIIKHCGGIQGVVPVPPQPLCNLAPIPDATAAKESTIPQRRLSSVKPPSLALPLARHIAILNQTGTSVSVRCGKCSKPMQRSASSTASGAPIPSLPRAPWACARHPSAETVLSTCAVCHMTVRGIYLWCVGCSHGGHLNHIREWINRRAKCPAGCGHYCEYGNLDSSLYLQISA